MSEMDVPNSEDNEELKQEEEEAVQTVELEKNDKIMDALETEIVRPTEQIDTTGSNLFDDARHILHPDYQLAHAEEDKSWLEVDLKTVPNQLLWIFYVRTWLPSYSKTLLKADFIAGLTVVGMAVPQAIAYTGVIGVSPSLGLYTACIGLCLYPLFGTSRHVTFGCSSMSTILTLAVMANFPAASLTDAYATGVKTLAFMTGVFYFGMAVFGIGFIASFLAYPVLLGFTGGAALQIAASQLKYAFALNPHTTTWIENVKLLQHWDSFNWKAFACCVATFATLMTFKGVPKYFPGWKYSKLMKSTPMTLILVVFFTLINFGGRFLNHATKGDWNKGTLHAPEIIGQIAVDFPTRIDLDFSLVNRHPNIFLLQALSAAVVIFTTHIAVAANYALKHEYDLIPTREMYAHGIINLIGSLFGIFPAGGVFTHAPLADQAGAKTLVFNWICAVAVIGVMILISGCPGLLYWLPRSVLAGIVWSACVGMFPYEKIKEIFSIDTKDSYIVAVTLLCTTLWGIFEGIEVGFALSIVFLVQRSSKPHCAIVGRIAHTTMYGSITSWPNAITTPGIVVFRFDGALYFGNVNYFKRAIQVVVERHRRNAKQLYFLVLDCSAINDMDSSGVLALDNAHKHLDQNNVALILTDVKYPVMKLIKRSHLLKLIGTDRIFHNIFQAHMYILARLKLINGENLLEDKLYDYIDEKGFNRIQFDNVNITALERPLTDHEQALILQWQPFDIGEKVYPWAKEKKGFELRGRSIRFSLAPKSEQIHVAPPPTLAVTENKPSIKDMDETPVRVA